MFQNRRWKRRKWCQFFATCSFFNFEISRRVPRFFSKFWRRMEHSSRPWFFHFKKIRIKSLDWTINRFPTQNLFPATVLDFPTRNFRLSTNFSHSQRQMEHSSRHCKMRFLDKNRTHFSDRLRKDHAITLSIKNNFKLSFFCFWVFKLLATNLLEKKTFFISEKDK